MIVGGWIGIAFQEHDRLSPLWAHSASRMGRRGWQPGGRLRIQYAVTRRSARANVRHSGHAATAHCWWAGVSTTGKNP